MEKGMRKNLSTDFLQTALEFCSVAMNAMEFEKNEFTARMLGLLPLLYMQMSEVSSSDISLEEKYLGEYADEDLYENVRKSIAAVMGADDAFLETFEQDMRYSDTPIGTSISEGLADVFQDLYNFSERVRNSSGDDMDEALCECKEDFENYWGQKLCNTLRALHAVRYSGDSGSN